MDTQVVAVAYMEVAVEGENLHNRTLEVTVTHTDGETLFGVIKEEQI